MKNLRDREVYDNELRRQAQLDRENNSAAGGVALGIVIAGLVGAGIAAYALLNKQPEAQAPQQNTVIERTKELVPVPQPKTPDVKAPDINITVPDPVKPAPETGSTQPDSNARSSSNNDSSSDKSAKSDSSTSKGDSSTSGSKTAPVSENP
ncbi:MAG TPA: hypothetical protein V6D10_17985 [Trichocoleus sp.]|jgi:hypothetical protein